MDEKQKKQLRWICLTGALYALILIILHIGPGASLNVFPVNFLLFLIPYCMVGWKVIRKSIINISHGQVFDENFLMMVATFGALAIGEYSEAVAVMLFYQVGEFFEDFAVGRSRRSITQLMDIAPEYANVERDGKLTQIDPEEVKVGDIFVVRPGERVPLDGVVTEGSSMLDTAALTGESVPRSVHTGDEVISGCVNGDGVLKIRAEKAYEDSTVSRVLDLVENASDRKARTENFVTRFARYYTPVVVFAAVAVAILLPLLTGVSWQQGLKSACIFLVVSCPCAFVLSVPLTFFGGIGAASHMGILIKGSNYLEAAAKLKTVVFDKTGTLTRGEFSVTQILPAGEVSKEKLLKKAACAEHYSTHPVADSIRRAYAQTGNDPAAVDASEISENTETAGHGVSVVVNGQKICAGNRKLMDAEGVAVPPVETAGTVVYVSEEGKYLGAIVISDIVKPEAKEAIRSGIHSAKWPGRMEEKEPGVVLDGAHNPSGIRAFLESASALCDGKKAILLFSALKDKKLGEMVPPLASSPIWEKIYVTGISSPRAAAPEELAEMAEKYASVPVECIADPLKALEAAKGSRKEGEYLFCSGSLYLVGELEKLYD